MSTVILCSFTRLDVHRYIPEKHVFIIFPNGIELANVPIYSLAYCLSTFFQIIFIYFWDSTQQLPSPGSLSLVNPPTWILCFRPHFSLSITWCIHLYLDWNYFLVCLLLSPYYSLFRVCFLFYFFTFFHPDTNWYLTQCSLRVC